MPLYDSFIIAMGGAGTGGFAVYNDSIAHYNSSLITNIVSIGTLLFGINFNLYYFLLLRKFKAFFGDEELRTYIGIVIISTVLIWLNVSGLYETSKKDLNIPFLRLLLSLQRQALELLILLSGLSFHKLSYSY